MSTDSQGGEPDKEMETEMDIDELRRRWSAQERRLESSLQLNARVLRTLELDKAESRLQRLRFVLGFEILQDALAVLLLGGFLGQHLGEFRFALPGLALFGIALGFLVTSIRHLILANAIDHGAPVTAIQRRLETLRMGRISHAKWIVLLSPVIWVPILIVCLQGFLGVDAWKVLAPTWIVANLLFGLAFIPVVFFLCRRYSESMQGSPFVQGLMRDVAGKNLTAALAHLGAITEFEREDSGSRHGSEPQGQ